MAAVLRASNEEEEKAAEERGLVRISYDEARAECFEICGKWTPTSEVFWLNYGAIFSCAISAVPGVFLTALVRKWNNVPHKVGGRLLTIMPATLIPVVSSGWVAELAKENILMNKTRCPVCLDLRITGLQLFLGVVAPTAISITGSHSYLATLSYRLPNPMTRKYFSWIGSMLRKSRVFLGCLAASQVIYSAFLLHAQREEWANVNRKLYQELSETSSATEAARRGELKPIIG